MAIMARPPMATCRVFAKKVLAKLSISAPMDIASSLRSEARCSLHGPRTRGLVSGPLSSRVLLSALGVFLLVLAAESAATLSVSRHANLQSEAQALPEVGGLEQDFGLGPREGHVHQHDEGQQRGHAYHDGVLAFNVAPPFLHWHLDGAYSVFSLAVLWSFSKLSP